MNQRNTPADPGAHLMMGHETSTSETSHYGVTKFPVVLAGPGSSYYTRAASPAGNAPINHAQMNLVTLATRGTLVKEHIAGFDALSYSPPALPALQDWIDIASAPALLCSSSYAQHDHPLPGILATSVPLTPRINHATLLTYSTPVTPLSHHSPVVHPVKQSLGTRISMLGADELQKYWNRTGPVEAIASPHSRVATLTCHLHLQASALAQPLWRYGGKFAPKQFVRG
ncbi:uncharacterized protein N7482_004760 [Penicillium canariense]|uniref:Uncharacterized protein n=1 Tax=Penicillium canariense TaxID=189055 RepID=A0A9W9LQD8_9EURO|nr:uncharacterized protein N7482_004760 [Penicillium canariense]KAJ5169166.1 hypothetical protein N7482_004760 [Penicillium canariense]